MSTARFTPAPCQHTDAHGNPCGSTGTCQHTPAIVPAWADAHLTNDEARGARQNEGK